jgi:hypothetical protein
MTDQGQAQPGWYPDPSGPAGQRRWWDGTRWTEHTQGAAGAPGAPAAPAAQAAAPSSSGGGTSNALKIILIVLGVLALLTVGGCVACAALVGETADDVGREFERELERQQNLNAITTEQYEAVELGTRRSEVRKRLGEPANEERTGGTDCMTYNRREGDLGDTFQFCFEDGRLDTKNAY